METYTISELSEILNVSERTIIRQFQTFFDKYKNLYSKGVEIPFELAQLVFNRQIPTKNISSDSEEKSDLIEQEFTAEEFEKFMAVIEEYPTLKAQIEISNQSLKFQKDHIKNLEKQIEYLQFSYNKQLQIHEKMIETFQQRNFIEAKEKKLDQ